MTSRRELFLQEMGLGPLWKRRDAATLPDSLPLPGMDEAEHEPPLENPVSVDAEMPMSQIKGSAPSASAVAMMNWDELKAEVAGCVKCGLCNGRRQTVFGVGDERAKWLFVGEGPGRNEDLQGEPFVGPAGKLLDNMLRAIGLKRGDRAYIGNIVKCRPTDANGRDRPPTPEESAACMPYLERQIELIQPKLIVALGKTAALSLLELDPETPVSRLRGKVHRYRDWPLIVTYHPAYLLRNLGDKRKAWEDLCLALKTYDNAA